MTRRNRFRGAGLAMLLWLWPTLAAAQALPASPVNPRQDLEGFARVLDDAVRKVSRAAMALGNGDSCRAYHLPGYGAIFALSPRSLPTRVREILVLRGAPLEAVRAAEAARKWDRRAKDAELERALRAMEADARAFQQEAERTQREVERAFEKAMAEVNRQIQVSSPAPPTPPEAPTPPEPPAPPSLPPPPPPWSFWFETDDGGEDQQPEVVVQDVKTAVTDALERQGGRVRILRPDEFLVVAVDFLPRGGFASRVRPEKTLLVRVRKKELEERAAGKLGAGDLRKRIEYIEY